MLRGLVDRVEHWLPRVLVVVVVAMLGVALWLWWDTSREFAPLAYTPEPRPVERIEPSGVVTVPTVAGFPGPGVALGDTIPTGGLLCSTADDPIDVFGNLWWTIPGTNVLLHTVIDVPGVIDPGCMALRFENTIPAVVAGVARERGPEQWVIVGDTRPARSGGVAAAFTMEPVWIIPDPAGGSGG